MIAKPSIANLEEIIDSLPDGEKELFQRIYAVSTTVGELRVPQPMQPWVRQQFGSVDAITRQKIVKITNRVTDEESLFNQLRNSRPIEMADEKDIEDQLLEASQKDSFRHPEENTPEDIFGRVTGRHCVTASNIAKYDGLHGMVIFNQFHPLHFSREQVIDYIDAGWEWAKRAQAERPQARYFLLVWNCLWRAGASICHGHAQVMLTEGRHYAKIEKLRQAVVRYRQEYGSNYFADLAQAHHAAGCAVAKGGVEILASLTPFRDNEVMLVADRLDRSLKERTYEVLSLFRDRLDVVSFNLGLITPPLAETEEDWEGFPVIVRVVDRGNPNSRASDVGGVEIYAASVVSSDPLELARQLHQYLG